MKAQDKSDLWRSGELLFYSAELGHWWSDGRITIEPGESLKLRCQYQADLEGHEAKISLAFGEGAILRKPRPCFASLPEMGA